MFATRYNCNYVNQRFFSSNLGIWNRSALAFTRVSSHLSPREYVDNFQDLIETYDGQSLDSMDFLISNISPKLASMDSKSLIRVTSLIASQYRKNPTMNITTIQNVQEIFSRKILRSKSHAHIDDFLRMLLILTDNRWSVLINSNTKTNLLNCVNFLLESAPEPCLPLENEIENEDRKVQQRDSIKVALAITNSLKCAQATSTSTHSFDDITVSICSSLREYLKKSFYSVSNNQLYDLLKIQMFFTSPFNDSDNIQADYIKNKLKVVSRLHRATWRALRRPGATWIPPPLLAAALHVGHRLGSLNETDLQAVFLVPRFWLPPDGQVGETPTRLITTPHFWQGLEGVNGVNDVLLGLNDVKLLDKDTVWMAAVSRLRPAPETSNPYLPKFMLQASADRSAAKRRELVDLKNFLVTLGNLPSDLRIRINEQPPFLSNSLLQSLCSDEDRKWRTYNSLDTSGIEPPSPLTFWRALSDSIYQRCIAEGCSSSLPPLLWEDILCGIGISEIRDQRLIRWLWFEALKCTCRGMGRVGRALVALEPEEDIVTNYLSLLLDKNKSNQEATDEAFVWMRAMQLGVKYGLSAGELTDIWEGCVKTAAASCSETGETRLWAALGGQRCLSVLFALCSHPELLDYVCKKNWEEVKYLFKNVMESWDGGRDKQSTKCLASNQTYSMICAMPSFFYLSLTSQRSHLNGGNLRLCEAKILVEFSHWGEHAVIVPQKFMVPQPSAFHADVRTSLDSYLSTSQGNWKWRREEEAVAGGALFVDLVLESENWRDRTLTVL